MEKKIITISREFGSGGRTIGHMVAERLGIPFYDKDLVDHIALESGFAPNFIEEHGEHAPSSSIFAYAFAHQSAPGVMNGLSTADFLWNVGNLPYLICHLGGAVVEEDENRISLGVNGMRNPRWNQNSIAQVFRSGTLHLHAVICGNDDVGSHVTVLRRLKRLCANQDMVIGFIQFCHAHTSPFDHDCSHASIISNALALPGA